MNRGIKFIVVNRGIKCIVVNRGINCIVVNRGINCIVVNRGIKCIVILLIRSQGCKVLFVKELLSEVKPNCDSIIV